MSTYPDEAAVRHETGNAVRRLVRVAGGQFADRPLIRSDPDGRTVSEPEPLAGITAATAVEREARRLCLESVRYAREGGLTWRAIGGAMGFADSPRASMTSVAEHAFQQAVRAVPAGLRADWFTWTCPSCRKLIRDYGPELGPYEAEQGHGDDCARLAETIRAWDAQWDAQWEENEDG